MDSKVTEKVREKLICLEKERLNNRVIRRKPLSATKLSLRKCAVAGNKVVEGSPVNLFKDISFAISSGGADDKLQEYASKLRKSSVQLSCEMISFDNCKYSVKENEHNSKNEDSPLSDSSKGSWRRRQSDTKNLLFLKAFRSGHKNSIDSDVTELSKQFAIQFRKLSATSN